MNQEMYIIQPSAIDCGCWGVFCEFVACCVNPFLVCLTSSVVCFYHLFGWQVPFGRCHCWQDLFSASANKDKTHGVANYQA